MSVVSGGMSAGAARKASSDQKDAAEYSAELQLQAAREAIAFQREMAEQAREDVAPWREAGVKALETLQEKISEGPGDFESSPGYEFRLSEGTKALERGAAARGNLLGGAEQKALTRYGQDYATQDYDNFLRRYYESMTPLQSLAGIGQSSASQTAGQAANLGTSVGNILTNTAANVGQTTMAGANAAAAGYINAANAISGAGQANINNAMAVYDTWKNTPTATTPSATTYTMTGGYGSNGGNAIETGSWGR